MNLSTADRLGLTLLLAVALIALVAVLSMPPVGRGRHASELSDSDLRTWVRAAARWRVRRLRRWAWQQAYVPRMAYRKVRLAVQERRAVSA